MLGLAVTGATPFLRGIILDCKRRRGTGRLPGLRNVDPTGGTHTVSGLVLGYTSGSTGSYSLGGGALNVNGDEYIGGYGIGQFTQTVGTHTVTGQLVVATLSGASGTYNMNGGTLTAGGIIINSGGTFNLQSHGPTTLVASNGIINSGTMSIASDLPPFSGPT